MMDLGESGPLEIAQIVVLAAASCAFLLAALKTGRPGAPAFAVFSLVLGVAALREYSAEANGVWQSYLESHAARWHLAAVLMVPLIFVTARDRAVGVWSHARAVVLMVPIFGLGIALVWLAAAIEEWGGTVTLTEAELWNLLLIEEVLELLAYATTLLVALKAASKARQDASASFSLVTVLPTRRRRGGGLIGRA
ncbi:hypothetical protein [Brevundimonas sp. DC300-4]|uniref:hypothetical protein n=1 Tax=Brevundimonas sp. DC300-4 TaxID=2804594 RepID=UPI003CEACDC1